MSSTHISKKTTFWKNKNVLVTGGAGFLGSFVVEELLTLGAKVSITSHRGELANIAPHRQKLVVFTGDLNNREFADTATEQTEIVIHLASKVAGIQYNVGHPVEMFNETVQMAKNILESSHKNKVERVFLASSACVYPRYSTIPTPELEGFRDDPEETNIGYGWAKRVVELMGRFYHKEYGMKIAIARPYNMYGPRDQFDPALSHVIPGIIRRVLSGENPLSVWGSGKQTRSFLYVQDCVEGILSLTEHITSADPVNLGASDEISIADLTHLIVELSGSNTKVIFDRSKPDGQPRRSCDITKANNLIHFTPKTSLRDGLIKTIEWYKQHS